MLDLARPDPAELEELGQEFRDLLFDFPFQIPQDFIYLGRALGIVSGLVAQLDEQINPWYYIEKYGEALLASHSGQRFGRFVVEGMKRPYDFLKTRFLPDWARDSTILLIMQTAESRMRLKRGRSIFTLFQRGLVSDGDAAGQLVHAPAHRSP